MYKSEAKVLTLAEDLGEAGSIVKTKTIMKNKDYTAIILVDQTPKEVFDAVTNVRAWWSEEVKDGTERLNDEFKYHYKDVHNCTMKLIEVIPNEKVVWLVLDNYFNFVADKTEWTGTKVCFEISKQGDQTQLVFTHIGLVPAYECFDVCSNAWGGYISHSLRSLITKGKGQPNQKENETELISESLERVARHKSA